MKKSNFYFFTFTEWLFSEEISAYGTSSFGLPYAF